MHQFRCAVPRQIFDRWQLRSSLVHVGRVVAGRAAGDQVFPGLRVHHELLRLRAAHRAGIGLHGDKVETAAAEDRAIRRIVLVVADIQTGRIQIEGIAILHDELAHPQQPRPGPRFVAELGLNLVPDLGQLLVTA